MIGKIKDETSDQVISHFCANRSKSYSFKLNNKEVSKNTLKGIVKAVRTKMITFEDLKKLYFEGDKVKSMEQTRFETDEHVIKTVTRTKIALESTDDKPVVLKDKVFILAHGHHRLLSL